MPKALRQAAGADADGGGNATLKQRLTPKGDPSKSAFAAGMVKRYHASFPSLSYGFDSRYPLQSPRPFAAYLDKQAMLATLIQNI